MQNQKLYVPAQFDEQDVPVVEVRSGVNRSLLARLSADGMLLWDRKSRLSHLLSWDEIIAHHQHAHNRP